MKTQRKKIIIVGAGFAGLKLARGLNNTAFDVLLIDKLNHHQFQPLFYQVATAGLEPANISFPLRDIFHHSKNVRIRMAEVLKILPSQNRILTTSGDYDFDYLVIATGAGTNFFGNANIGDHALPMKTTGEAIEIRQRILQNFEQALSVAPADQEPLLDVVIAGGGPTGVELAGALAEMKKNVLWKDYPEVDFSRMNIILVEGSGRTLSTMSEEASKASQGHLTKLGVEVWTNTRVKDFDGKTVLLDNGKKIDTGTLVWAAGVRGNLIEGLNFDSVVKNNRIVTDRFNRVQGMENIFAIGDIAFLVTPNYPNGHPQVANVAINQAKLLADNLLLSLKGKPMKEFEYRDKGSMATVGKHKAVVDLPWIKFQGWFAWYIWMGLHLLLLMGMKNQLFVFINWVVAYFTNNSALRLIFRREK
jgi:NADH dehydrogenase